jgi:hypothetical protein
VASNTLADESDLKKRENIAFLLVVLPAAVILSFMWLLPLHFQRSVFPPSNTLVSGALYGGALIMGPPFAGFATLCLPLASLSGSADAEGVGIPRCYRSMGARVG